jgi:cell division protein FtsB
MKRGYYILGILALLYLIFLTGRSAYQNWQTNQEVKKLKVEIETLEVENQNLQNLIAYYQTQSFKEKEARRKLGLVKPDEKVVIISKEQAPSKKSTESISEEPKKPNYILWWQFFFKQ